MKRAGAAWVVAGFLALASPAQAPASGFMVSKMGGDLSGATEPNGAATFWNPAAIGPIEGSSLFLDANWIWREAGFVRTWDKDFDFGRRSADAGTMQVFAVLPMVAGTFHPARQSLDWLTLGFGFYTPFGNRSDWPSWDLEAERKKPTEQQAAPAQAYQALTGNLEVLYFTPVAAVRLTDGLWFGAGVSWVHAIVQATRLQDYSLGLFPPEKVPTSGLADLNFAGDGVGWSLGLYAQPARWLRLGLSFTSGVSLDLPGTARLTLPDYLVALYGQEVSSDALMALRLPAALRAAVHWDVTDWLVLRLTAEFVAWSAFNQMRVHGLAFRNDSGPVGGTLGDTKEFISPRDYRDTIDLRFGFRVFPMPWWMLFAGVGIDQDAIPDSTQSADIFDSFKIGFAGGTRVQILPLLGAVFGGNFGPADRFTLTAGVNYIHFQDREVTGNLPDQTPNGTYSCHVLMLDTNFEARF